MKKLFLLTLTAVFVSALTAVDAEAQLTYVGPSCDLFDGFVSSTGPVDYDPCWGAFSGNDQPGDVIAYLSGMGVSATWAGKTDSGATGGPFEPYTGASTGRLTFKVPISGVFILSLKSSTKFSLYQFDTMGESWAWLDYGTAGTSLNPQGRPQALSHASLFTVVTPEPGTVFLLGMGLFGMGFVAWRRREDALA